jgi:monofunctional biosynthetic peptidoglycan transglycosylase
MKKKRKTKNRVRHRPIRFLFLFTLRATVGFVLLTTGLVLLLRWVNPPTSAFMVRYTLHQSASITDLALPDYRWADWKTISPHAAMAVIASEDQKFPMHGGFDFDSMADALDDYVHGEKLRGASTISQQTAKNLFLWPGRSMIRKALEAWFTIWLEIWLPKQRILEIYLNIIEFGPGIYGIEAASKQYFNRGADRITPAQAARMAVVLPAPHKLDPVGSSWYVQRRSAWVQKQMRQLGGTRYLSHLQRPADES